MSRYDHLARIINNCGEVALSEVHKDAERMIQSNPSIADLAEYVCMLEDSAQAIEQWAEMIHGLRRSLARTFMETLERIAKEAEE